MNKDIKAVLDRIRELMEHPAVVKAFGEYYSAGELAAMKAGWESGEDIGKALELGDIMLRRVGFAELKGDVWVDRDHQVIEKGLEDVQG